MSVGDELEHWTQWYHRRWWTSHSSWHYLILGCIHWERRQGLHFISHISKWCSIWTRSNLPQKPGFYGLHPWLLRRKWNYCICRRHGHLHRSQPIRWQSVIWCKFYFRVAGMQYHNPVRNIFVHVTTLFGTFYTHVTTLFGTFHIHATTLRGTF